MVLDHNIYSLHQVIAEDAKSLSSISVVWSLICRKVQSAPSLEPKDRLPNHIQCGCRPHKHLVISLVMRPGTRGDDRQLVALKLERPEMVRVLGRTRL